MRLDPYTVRTAFVVVGGAGLCALIVAAGVRWPILPAIPGLSHYLSLEESKDALPLHPFYQLLKLAVAFVIGVVVTSVHRHFHRDKLLRRAMEQAETLLCVAGALMMIIIGGSLARAFGVFGAAGLVRFRTPVEDPKDATILFILLGIGMACGVGLFGVALLAALFLCLFLYVLDQLGEKSSRVMFIDVRADGTEFPKSHVENIFAAYGAVYEAREVSHGKDTAIRYFVVLEPNTPLDAMTEQLMASGYSGIKSVTWESPKKRD